MKITIEFTGTVRELITFLGQSHMPEHYDVTATIRNAVSNDEVAERVVRQGGTKIDMIKKLRGIQGLDLKVAKDVIEEAAERIGHTWPAY